MFKLIVGIFFLVLCGQLHAQDSVVARDIDQSALQREFADAQKVDLRTSTAPSVVKLRDKVKLPPPDMLALVKAYNRSKLPAVLEPIFANPQIMGVTIHNRYIAVIETDFGKEYNDTLNHELVHAYMCMVSPKPLPFWFQEASAVHFSTDKPRKIYARASETQEGMVETKVVDLADNYKQKLQSFHYLIESAGEARFNAWHRKCVLTGIVDTRPLLGLPPIAPGSVPASESLKTRGNVLLFAGMAVVVAVIGIGVYAVRQHGETG